MYASRFWIVILSNVKVEHSCWMHLSMRMPLNLSSFAALPLPLFGVRSVLFYTVLFQVKYTLKYGWCEGLKKDQKRMFKVAAYIQIQCVSMCI